MTIAALALAMALMVAPPPYRHRVGQSPVTRRRLPPMAVAATLAAVVAATLPVAATLAAGILGGTLILRRRRTIARRARAFEASELQGAPRGRVRCRGRRGRGIGS